jgi:hypothetical protein
MAAVGFSEALPATSSRQAPDDTPRPGIRVSDSATDSEHQLAGNTDGEPVPCFRRGRLDPRPGVQPATSCTVGSAHSEPAATLGFAVGFAVGFAGCCFARRSCGASRWRTRLSTKTSQSTLVTTKTIPSRVRTREEARARWRSPALRRGFALACMHRAHMAGIMFDLYAKTSVPMEYIEISRHCVINRALHVKQCILTAKQCNGEVQHCWQQWSCATGYRDGALFASCRPHPREYRNTRLQRWPMLYDARRVVHVA